MSSKKTYDAGDPEQVKKARKAHRTERETTEHDLKTVLQTYEGRATLWRVIEKCGVFDSSYRGDVHQMVYLEGRRNIGLTIIADVNNADPEAFVRMTMENRERTLKKEAATNG